MKWLDEMPLVLVMVTGFLGFAPFIPEPHLFEKIGMLSSGALSKPLDIFDLFMHGTAFSIFFAKLFRELWNQYAQSKS